MEYTQILYEVADHIATITLNRPEQLNAFTNTMMRELIDAIADGSLTITVGGHYPLAEARRAHEDLQGRRTTGSIVVVP